jgi:hypothetical protein
MRGVNTPHKCNVSGGGNLGSSLGERAAGAFIWSSNNQAHDSAQWSVTVLQGLCQRSRDQSTIETHIVYDPRDSGHSKHELGPEHIHSLEMYSTNISTELIILETSYGTMCTKVILQR